MARKSRAVPGIAKETTVVTISPKVYKVGVYRRLSVEDGEDEINNSIGNQKKIADDYVLYMPSLQIVKYYADNGFTGMNYRRPGFMEMMDDLMSGQIDTVLVKDISRLGRHYILTSELVEKTFPSMGIRLISINDNYDSHDENADVTTLLLPIKMIMNDNYAKDFSKKIRSSIHSKIGCGEFLPSAGSIPYGYIRDERNRTFAIDKETAPVVRRIFEMREAGIAFNEIAKVLNAEGIPSPGHIRFLRGITKNPKYQTSNWIRGTIRKITEDLVYTGCRVHGKVKRDRLDQIKTRRDKEEWTIIENAHEAIVSKEMYERVNALNKEKVSERDSFEHRELVLDDKRELLRNKIFCGDCGSRMSGRKGLGRKSAKYNSAYIFFDCNQYHDTGKRKCKGHYIRQEAIISALNKCLDIHLQMALDFEAYLEKVKQMPKVISYQGMTKDRVASLRVKKNGMEAKKEQLVSDVIAGVLTTSEFEYMKNRLENELLQLEEEIKEAEKCAGKLNQIESTAERWIQELKEQKSLGTLNRKLLDLLVDRILVYDKDTIKIEVNFSDPFIPLKEYVSQMEEVFAYAV